ncbi:MAG: UDP-N-acetylmuramoyl-L-alanyl-D-glutamate--2,6-diaminopimelate ligase [Lachnospiraceae bacterium]|nr:UDP-N-acetylmuramoyl-L-alanyl-D-glutamate--2,6-diaminopimelate ligase [Lachnospiraceae bacterium]
MGLLKDWLEGIAYDVLSGTDEAEVSDVISDSRKAAPGTVFLCMKGTKTDSHTFIREVAAKGCGTFVVEKDLGELELPEEKEGLNIIRVQSARRAMSVLASARFDHPSRKMCMIGLTGTKGKTSTSYMIKTLLEESGRNVGVIGTNGCVIRGKHFETKNTTPDSYELNQRFHEMVEAGCDAVVMECSSQGFKLDRTAGITFDYGIFLNISPDHIGPLEHADFNEYLWCKSRLLTQSKTVIINADDEHTGDVLRAASMRGSGSDPVPQPGSCESSPEFPFAKLLRFSLKDKAADLYAHDLKFEINENFTGTEFATEGLICDSFRLSIPGTFNVSNALAVLALAHEMQLPEEAVKRALAKVHVDGRMEAVYRSNRLTVIVDYAHNEVSMVSLLDTLKSYKPGRLVVVFGCGGNRSKDRRTGMGAAAAHAADFCIFTADNSRYEKTEDIIADIEEAYLGAGGDPDGYVKIPDRREAIRYAMAEAKDGDLVAVIGKGHEDYQEENGVRKHFLDREEILKIKDELGL